jgi:hypothetical protein
MPAAPRSPAAAPRRAVVATATRQVRRALAQRRLRRRRLVITMVMIVGLLAAGAYALDWWTGTTTDEVVVPPPVPQLAEVTPTPSPPSPTPTPIPLEETEPPPVLTSLEDFPTSGPGTFTFAPGSGEVLGDAGSLRRFRIGVEDGITMDLAELAVFVDGTLGHEKGWTAGGDLRLQRVAGDADHDYTIFLATSETTERLCADAGLQVIAPSFPEGGVSCRTPGRAILNLSRWHRSVPHYVDAEVPLETYRQMLINHEVGHELGYGHYGCPGRGEPAPVMQQQSLFLDGCEANPWPYLDGEFHTGPPVS